MAPPAAGPEGESGPEKAKGGPGSAQVRVLPSASARARYAACLGLGPELFFARERRLIERAKPVCPGCSGRRACLKLALAEPALVGVWGGLSEAERRGLQRRLN